MVTINMWQLGSTADTIFFDFADVRTWFARWSRRAATRDKKETAPANGTPTYTYVHEDRTGDHSHTHWMVHVADGNEERFINDLEKRLLRQFGLESIPENALHVTQAKNPEGAKLYMAKGLRQQFADLWKIRPTDCGRIARRRADSSRNIGPSTWQPLKWEYKYGRMAA